MKLLRLALRLAWWICLAVAIYSATLVPLVFCVVFDVYDWWYTEQRHVLDLETGRQQGRLSAWQEAIGHLKNRGRS